MKCVNQILASHASPALYFRQYNILQDWLGWYTVWSQFFMFSLSFFENHIKTFNIYYICETGHSMIFYSKYDTGAALKNKLFDHTTCYS